MAGKNALLLVASPRGAASTSYSLGSHLLAQLQKKGVSTDTVLVYKTIDDPPKLAGLLTAIEAGDLIILAFPLYVDHLPAPLIRLLQWISEQRRGRSAAPGQTLAAIINCGFPETAQCRLAAETMRHFAAQAGFRFLGCLATGMGGAIGNRELTKAGGIVRHQVRALNQAAPFLAAGAEIPARVIELMGKTMMPRWFYCLVSYWGWKRAARKFKVSESLYDRPYNPERLT
jgi:NAD(P)H-dependent FMN reductase